MELQMHKTAGSQSITLSDAAFGNAFNESLVHQVVTAFLAGGRAGTKAQKTRAMVRGGGRKPRPQKGSGQARALLRAGLLAAAAHHGRSEEHTYELQSHVNLGCRLMLE